MTRGFVMDRLTEIGYNGMSKISRKMVFLRQVKQVFFIFLVKFLAYLMIFQSFAEPLVHSTLKSHQTWQAFGKK